MSNVKSKRPPKKTTRSEIDERTEVFAQFTLNNGSAEAIIPTCIKRARKMWKLKTWPDLSFQRVLNFATWKCSPGWRASTLTS